MLDPILKARALAALNNPPPRTPERDERIYAYMTAESLKLEGIDTSTEEILELVKSLPTHANDEEFEETSNDPDRKVSKPTRF